MQRHRRKVVRLGRTLEVLVCMHVCAIFTSDIAVYMLDTIAFKSSLAARRAESVIDFCQYSRNAAALNIPQQLRKNRTTAYVTYGISYIYVHIVYVHVQYLTRICSICCDDDDAIVCAFGDICALCPPACETCRHDGHTYIWNKHVQNIRTYIQTRIISQVVHAQ